LKKKDFSEALNQIVSRGILENVSIHASYFENDQDFLSRIVRNCKNIRRIACRFVEKGPMVDQFLTDIDAKFADGASTRQQVLLPYKKLTVGFLNLNLELELPVHPRIDWQNEIAAWKKLSRYTSYSVVKNALTKPPRYIDPVSSGLVFD